MDITGTTETLPFQTSPSSPAGEYPLASNSSSSIRTRRLRLSPGTPTPLRRASQQTRKTNAPIGKRRAVSTGALPLPRVNKSRPSLPGTFPLPTPAPAPQAEEEEGEDAARSSRGVSEPPRTPNRPAVAVPTSSQSSPAVPTRSKLKPQKKTKEQMKKNKNSEKESHWVADESLFQKIRNNKSESPGKDAEPGTNYVLSLYHEDDKTDEFIKVGKTKKCGNTRRKQIRSNCGHIGHNVSIPGQVPTMFRKQIETLVHTELLPYKYALKCRCGVGHGEFFKAPAPLAVEALQRWTRFCESHPWDSLGALNPVWKSRLDNLQASGKLHKATPEARAVLWEEFTDAGSLPFWLYNVKCFSYSALNDFLFWLVVGLSAAFSITMGPGWFVLYWNLLCQIALLLMYTHRNVNYVWNQARKGVKDRASPTPLPNPVSESPESEHETDTEDEHLAGDRACESAMSDLDVPRQIPGSSVHNPIDLTSDIEVEDF